MKRSCMALGLAVFISALVSGPPPASAHGLIWSLPEDGTWVRYEGTYRQVEFRPDSPEGDLELEWLRHLWLKSVGRETAEYKGEMVPCRWIEIKVLTGRPKEGVLDPGPLGQRIYKVLVPESGVTGQIRDEEKLPVVFLPVVKGYRQIGNRPPQPLESQILQIYPLISLVMHYKDLQPEGQPGNPQIPLGPTTATRHRGTWTMENETNRTTSEGTLWRSEDVPFGLAKWSVTLRREQKDRIEPRSAFEPATEVTVEMSAHEVGRDAQSEVFVSE